MFRLKNKGTGPLVQAQDIRRVLFPVNSLSTWFIVAISTLVCFMIFGFNPQPLLAIGSVSGIVIGFASQEILLNLFAGITLFITHPFVVGDLVELRPGQWLAKATVLKIRPMRTTFLTVQNQVMALRNRMVMDSIVVTRKSRSWHTLVSLLTEAQLVQ